MDFCSAEELRRIGSLKWTGVKPADGSDVLGAWVAEMDFGGANDPRNSRRFAGLQPPLA